MLEQLKRALVESFVGAIALGWVFAQAILHFSFAWIAPFALWIQRKDFGPLLGSRGASLPRFSFLEALPDLGKSLTLLLVGYLLLRWLYFEPI
jgi:hypothetical protein